MRKGLLLGAGFSYDLGMPLVKTLTKDFFSFFSKKRLKSFIDLWSKNEPYGVDDPIEPMAFPILVRLVEKYRRDPELNYEGFLKEIEELIKNTTDRATARSYQYALSKFEDVLTEMFYIYHEHNFHIYENCKQFYKEFDKFIGDEPLWIMTLNHDLLIEFLCLDSGIPIKFGAVSSTDFPIFNDDFANLVEFGVNDRANLKLDSMDYLKFGKGANILKLHGALNEYTYDGNKKTAYVNVNETDKPMDYLKRVSKVMHKMEYKINGNSMRFGKDIAVSDMNGEMQFLSHTIKTGGNKFSKTINPKSGEEKMVLFEQILDMLDEITIVGYSFCDYHIDTRLYNAMLKNENLKVWIIDPLSGKNELFVPFDYSLRVRGMQCCTPEWLNYFTNKNWDIENMKILNLYRNQRSKNDEKLRNEFFKR